MACPPPSSRSLLLSTWLFHLSHGSSDWPEGGRSVIKTQPKCSTHIFTTIKTVLLGSHELSSHSVLVVSLLLVVELAGAAGEVSVVVQDQLKTSLVGGVAVGAVEGGHGDLDEGWVADLLTAVGRSAAGHTRPTV